MYKKKKNPAVLLKVLYRYRMDTCTDPKFEMFRNQVPNVNGSEVRTYADGMSQRGREGVTKRGGRMEQARVPQIRRQSL